MPVMGWVAIGTMSGTIVFTIIWWLVRRRVTRLDALETAVFGNEGVREKLHKYVTHEALNLRLEPIAEQMRGIAEEGERREERILAAIQDQTRVLGSAVTEIKTDLRAQAVRVDEVMRTRNGS